MAILNRDLLRCSSFCLLDGDLWTLISDGSDPYNRLVLSIALPNMSQVLQLKTIITWFISVHNVPMTSVACFSFGFGTFHFFY